MLSRITKVFSMVLAIVLLALSALPALAHERDENTLLDVATEINQQTGEFSILIAAIQAADSDVAEALADDDQLTVFAPTDAAFQSLLSELGISAGDLLGNRELVTKVLLYHVAPKRLVAADVLAADRIRMLKGGYLSQSGGVLTDANGRSANIVTPDAAFADNGVIHVIDRVVLPQMEEDKTLLDVAKMINQQTGEFSILLAAVQAADPRVAKKLADDDQLTVFAPTDAAFQSLLSELGVSAGDLLGNRELVTKVLLYHVAPKRLVAADVLAANRIRMLKGGFLFQSAGVLTDANGRSANIVTPDAAFADNGVIHVIDRVVLPAGVPATGKTVLDVAKEVNQQTGEFSILIAAVQAADRRVANILADDDQITVFAPTDAAFGSLLKELGVSAGDLLKNKKLLTKVLLYHVASGRLPAAGVLTSDRIRMLRGGHLSQSGGVLTDANGRTSTIIAPDAAFADNGVIHVIDRVVLPNLK